MGKKEPVFRSPLLSHHTPDNQPLPPLRKERAGSESLCLRHIFIAEMDKVVCQGDGGVNSCLNLSTELDKSCFCRPKFVQPVSVSAIFQQVMKLGHVLKMRSMETSPFRTSRSPTTLNMYAHLHTGLSWIIGTALPSLLPSDL